MSTVAFQVQPFGFGGITQGDTGVVRGESPLPSAPIGRVIGELIVSKEQANRRPIYIVRLRNFLNTFAKGRESADVSTFTAQHLESWLMERAEAPNTRRTNIQRFSALFSFARRKGYVRENPCTNIEKPIVDGKPPVILSPVEAGRALQFVRSEMRYRLGYVALGLFCGIRPAELQRLYWRDVDLARRVVRIDAAVSKVRRRRIVPIPENAVEWLELCRRNKKPFGPPDGHWTKEVKIGADIEWPHDILRHTAASYLLAKHEDVGRVSRWLGNSPTILLRHYTELVSAEDCAAFWSLTPSRLG